MTFVSRDIPHLKKTMTVVRLSLETHFYKGRVNEKIEIDLYSELLLLN